MPHRSAANADASPDSRSDRGLFESAARDSLCCTTCALVVRTERKALMRAFAALQTQVRWPVESLTHWSPGLDPHCLGTCGLVVRKVRRASRLALCSIAVSSSRTSRLFYDLGFAGLAPGHYVVVEGRLQNCGVCMHGWAWPAERLESQRSRPHGCMRATQIRSWLRLTKRK
jgi:hypothetical protein